jgi:hypothetical protein
MADTGMGTTVALTTSTFTASVLNVSEVGADIESLDITHLGLASTAYALKFPGDNPDLKDITITYFFKSDELALVPRALTSDTLTITLPIETSGNTTNMSIVLTGFIRSNTLGPPLARNQVNQGTLVFHPDGGTVTITKEAA